MSAAGPGRLSRSASKIVAKQADGFHLLRIDGYSQTKTVLPGQKLSSQGFHVGGHNWCVDYYPNGRDTSVEPNSISVYLRMVDGTHGRQQARYKFSLLDHAGIPAYELPAETGTFTSVPNVHPSHNPAAAAGEEPAGPGCGHEEFIGKEDLEKRCGDLIRDDSIVIRCDVGLTQIDLSCLAQDEIMQQDMYGPYAGYGGHPRRQHRRQHRANDEDYVKWCVNPAPAGSRGSPEEEDYY